jgi:molybdopterin-dependent oxidoreductase alpha subunit
VGLTSAVGVGTATVTLDDLEHAELVFVIGGNPASNHPRLMRSLMNVRRRGGDVIVINPVVETGLVNFSVPSDVRSLLFGSEIASLYVQPHIGGDLALLSGIAKRVVELGAVDVPFVTDHCLGWPELEAHLQALSWDDIVARSGVAREQIDAIARRYAAAKSAVFSWTMGITHHLHGVSNVQAIANLALLRGMVGRPNSGLLPIRGHSNVQGMGSLGVTPQLKEAVFQRLESHFDVQLPQGAGYDTMGSVVAAFEGRAKVGFCLGGNLYGSSPDANYAAAALGKLDLVVYLNTTLNTGHAHALGKQTVILPVLARDEEPQPTTQESMFSFVRLSDGGPRRLAGPRSEIEIVADLAERVLDEGGPVDWERLTKTREIRQAIGQIVPGWEAMNEIDETKQEFHITGRRLAEPRFPTANGRASLFVHELPELAGGDGQLRLMTVRSEGQFNTVVYEEADIYRGQERRDVVLVHPDDLRRLKIAADSRVTVRSDAGALVGVIARAFDRIKPGNALMYYPEANVLVPRAVDPRSRTPAFKNVAVRLEPVSPGWAALRSNGDGVAAPGNGEPAPRGNLKAC